MSAFIPTFTLGLLALAFLYKIHRRSVSTFLTVVMVASAANLFEYGYKDLAIVVLTSFMIMMLYRAILKPTNDKFFITIYRGEEKRTLKGNK